MTLYNRWKQWGNKGIFEHKKVGLAAEDGETGTVMIDVTYLKAHRTGTSMGPKKRGEGGGVAALSAGPRAA